jgi:uncharacterized protein (TIGR02246 family)
MQRRRLIGGLVAGLVCVVPNHRAHGQAEADRERDEFVALERAALDRWITLDPGGYLGLYVDDVSYFDATTEARVDGRAAMEARLAPMKTAKPPFTNPRYEMVAPRLQRSGDIAILTFNLVNYGRIKGGPETVLARWNSTEVYRRVDGKWRIIHSHWSFVRPDVKRPGI